MSNTHYDTVKLTTPQGHEVMAELDHDALALNHAKVVNRYSGIVKPLDANTTEVLTRALKAKRVYEEALAQTREAESTFKRFGGLAQALGTDHPAVAPYWEEAQKHKIIARDMLERAQQFHDDAMVVIDKLAAD